MPQSNSISFRSAAILFLWLAGLLLIASGLGHFVAFSIHGGSWEGPVSIRKPILFGLSGGATLLSVAWVAQKLDVRRGDAGLYSVFAAVMLVEVGLITMQQWRGAASHFNQSTAFDRGVDLWIGILILVATLVIAEQTRRVLCGRVHAEADMALAIRAGMVWLVLSCLFGFFMASHGKAQLAAGAEPGLYGDAGVMKFPHGVAIHAIQAFPALAWLLASLGQPVAVRRRVVGWGVAAQTAFALFALLQTLAGRARFDLTPGAALLLAITGCCLVPVAMAVLKPSLRLRTEPRRVEGDQA